MRNCYKSLLLLGIALLSIYQLQAQVTGAVTVPSGTYPDLASVITALNTQGVGAGGATITLTAANPQTAPAGGYQLGSTILNASTSAANRLRFIGSNNTITAQAGVSAAVGAVVGTDGIFTISGTDYVTITGLNLVENAANTTTILAMEWGYGLINLTATDGCQYDTIRNCTITLNRTVATPSNGIYNNHHLSTNGTVFGIAAASGLHSYNGYYGNNISNVVRGIALFGNSAALTPALFAQGNDVGGTSAATGNTVSNSCGTNYSSIGPVTATYHTGINISYNNVSNINNGGAAAVGATWGIYAFGAGGSYTINNNTITMSTASINSGYFQYGIYANAAGNIFTANNNNITLTQSTGIAVPCYGIVDANAANTVINNNTIVENMALTGASFNYGIYSIPTTNGVTSINGNNVQQLCTAASPSQFYSIAVAGTPVSETITNNIFNNSNVAFAGTIGYHMMIYTASTSGNKTITGNSVAGTYQSASSVPTYGVYNAPATLPLTGVCNISNNNLSNVTITTATGFVGIHNAPVVASPQSATLNGNTISNISCTLASLIHGIYQQNMASSDISGNTISGITSAGGVNGIYSDNNGISTTNIFRNKIHSLTNTSASGAGGVNGITIAGGTTTNIHNNTIGLLTAPTASSATDVIRGINLASTQPTSTIGIYYNSIYLNAVSSGANFSTTGIYQLGSATSTTATADIRNNIVINNSTPMGTGITAALRRSNNTGLNTAATSNRNIYWAGVPGTSRLIFYDGTNSIQTLAAYQTAAAPIDANSLTENSPFASTTGIAANFLHFNPSSNTFAESSGAAVTGLTTDFDNDIRFGNAGYTGNGTAVDIGADEFNNCAAMTVSAQPINDTACSAFAADFTLAVTGASLFQWQVNTGSGWTDVTNAGVYSGATTNMLVVTNPPASMNGYTYRVNYRQGPTCATATSNVAALSVTSSPSAAVTLSGPTSICQGDTLTLTAPTGLGLSYAWKIGTTTIPGATSNSYKATSSGSYTVVVSSTNGCSATSTPTVLTVNPKPVAYITYNSPIAFCEGSGVVLNASTATNTTFQWRKNGTAIPGETNNNVTITETGSYTVVINNAFNCATTSASIAVTVHPKPQPAIVANGLVLSVTQPFATYQWLMNNNAISGATNPTHTMASNGSYTIYVTDNNGCDNKSAPYYLGNLSAANVAALQAGILAYPNPAANYITVENKSAATMNSITILNALGQNVYNAETAVSRQTIWLNQFAPGVYTIRVNTNQGDVIKKLEIVR